MTRRRIVIVDDEPQIRGLLRTILEMAGYEIADLEDGRKALECIETWRPDLLITDLVMPDEEGMGLIRTVRQRHPHLAIIAMSGARGGAYLPVAKTMGASATLAKPFDARTLLAHVSRVLEPTGTVA